MNYSTQTDMKRMLADLTITLKKAELLVIIDKTTKEHLFEYRRFSNTISVLRNDIIVTEPLNIHNSFDFNANIMGWGNYGTGK